MGQSRTASRASSSRWSGTSASRMMGKPQSSRVISSGRISAHRLRPSQAMGSTRSLMPGAHRRCPSAGRAGRWLSGSHSTSLARAAPSSGPKTAEGAADQPDDAVGMVAGAAAVDLAEPAPQRAQIGCAAFGEPLEFAGDRVQAEEAWAALARRLVREVAHHPGSLDEPAGVRRAAPRSGRRPRSRPGPPGLPMRTAGLPLLPRGPRCRSSRRAAAPAAARMRRRPG